MNETKSEQDQIYALLEKMTQMVKELPNRYQQRFPNELLSSLATALVEGQIFAIVEALIDVQHGTEKQLFQQRLQLIKKFQDEKISFQSRFQRTVCEAPDDSEVIRLTAQLDAERKEMVARQAEEIKQFDIGLVLQIDQKVMDQQGTLEKAGVPGFYVTNNPTEVQVQMYLLEFIISLNKSEKMKS